MSTVTYTQIHPVEPDTTEEIVHAAAAPAKRVLTQTVWPLLRTIPGYLIMTPYSATILLLVVISMCLGLEDPHLYE